MAFTYDYSSDVTVTITNAIDINSCKYKACDAGTPVQRVVVGYESIKDKCGVKFDYLFDVDGSFMTVKKYNELNGTSVKDNEATNDYAVVSYQKFKNTDRKVPAYRTFNGKTLQPGDSVKFITSRKDEVVFYEKVVEAFGSKYDATATAYVGGELTMTVEPVPTEVVGE